MKLWLVRHAMPLVDSGVCYGASDVPADQQATLEAARSLADRLPTGLAVSCSPLRRCRQLADALCALRPDLAWRPDPRLAEMDFGRWEGARWDAIARDDLDGWAADFPGWRCGGGDSVAQLMARVAQALAEAWRTGGDALWITHGGVVGALRLLAAGVTLPKQAGDWPRDGLGFGQVECITMAPKAGSCSG
jgi:alpha-ribazole phosphatase